MNTKFHELRPGDKLWFVDRQGRVSSERIIRIGEFRSLDSEDDYISFVPEDAPEISWDVPREDYNHSWRKVNYCTFFTNQMEAEEYAASVLNDMMKELQISRKKLISEHEASLKKVDAKIAALQEKMNG